MHNCDRCVVAWSTGLTKVHIKILSLPEDVAAFVDDAQRASDSDKKALGFWPERAFKEAATQGKLLVAVVQENEKSVYAGHLLQGGVFPIARVFQIFIPERFRRRGFGEQLVQALVDQAERDQFLSVSAKVADDLDANTFWDRMGFELIRTKPGGRTTGRQINFRVRELSTPHLFRPAIDSVVSAQDLKLISRLFEINPVYALDLNVLFDLVKNRHNADDVGRIMGASFSNFVRLAITDEFVKELEGTSNLRPTDPILELAKRLPRLKAPSQSRLDEITSDLRGILFPGGSDGRNLSSQDRSDLVHLAIAIHNKAAGFITGDKAILRARPVLRSKFDLDVVGASEFADDVEPVTSEKSSGVSVTSGGQQLQGESIKAEDLAGVEVFLTRMRCPQPLMQDALTKEPNQPRRRMLVACDGAVIAVGFWEAPSAVRPHVHAFMCVDEDHNTASIALEFLIDSVCKESFAGFPIQVSLRLLAGHVTTRRLAIAHGFRPSAENGLELQKIALGRIITVRSWPVIADQLQKGMSLGLPAIMPQYSSGEQLLRFASPNGQTISVSLHVAENLLSPALILLPGRNGAIAPIKRVFAQGLLGGSKQLSLIGSPEAVVLQERVYFSGPNTAAVLTVGTPIVFYESGGSGGSASAIGVARIVRSELRSKTEDNQEVLRRSVLNENALNKICLSETVVATTIDNVIMFRNPVLLDRLRFLKAIDGANMVTARRITSDQLVQIAEEGMS